MKKDKMIVGNIEICSLPDLGINEIDVRIDTGAKTSSLHVDNIERIKRKGKPWLTFDIHPNIHKVDRILSCEAPIFDIRRVKSSNGISEERYVIQTKLDINNKQWDIELTLTDRSEMNHLMLLGRQGMGQKVLVDPAKSFLLGSSED